MSVRPSVPAWDYNNKPLLQDCRFAAVGPVGRTYRSTAARPALSSSGGDCGQCHIVDRRRKRNTGLFIIRPSFLPQYVELIGPPLHKRILLTTIHCVTLIMLPHYRVKFEKSKMIMVSITFTKHFVRFWSFSYFIVKWMPKFTYLLTLFPVLCKHCRRLF